MAQKDKIEAAADQLALDIQKYFDVCLADIEPKLRAEFEKIIATNAEHSRMEATMICELLGYTPNQVASYFLGILKMMQNVYASSPQTEAEAFTKLDQFSQNYLAPRGNA